MKSNFKNALKNLKDSTISVAPFFAVILVLYLIFLPFNAWMLATIILVTLLMIFGMSFFNAGVDMSTLKMGEHVGAHLSKSRKFSLMLILSFLMGFVVTIAEPDLMVMAEQVTGISSKWIILITVSAGTGIYLLLSTIKTIFRLSLKKILIVTYLLACFLAVFVPANFPPMSFDSIGVTTGAVSVPFIMSFGLGISAVRNSNDNDDGFGLIAMASIGPVIAMLILGFFVKIEGTGAASETVKLIANSSEMGSIILQNALSYLKEVFIVIIPIFAFFLIYNFVYLKLPKRTLLKMFFGLLYTYIGLVLFLVGVSSGYLTTANALGFEIVKSGHKWWLILIALVIGFSLVFAEPAVHVLVRQVEEVSQGIIRKKAMLVAISIGVSVAMLLCILRALFAINFLYIVVPLILIMVTLSIFCPNLFIGIAYDSGGAAAGSLSASFVLPFVVGVCSAIGVDGMQFAFGTIATISILPVITIQIMGIKYNHILKKKNKKAVINKKKIQIIDFE